ncbi:AAA-ATPase At5g17730-like [Henckelia pumila]|uniref:AAA-ATPase At5g17730-like n=1 Tax=Henckelia pumila TaxID=405737 RepID=UPI003C6DD8CE
MGHFKLNSDGCTKGDGKSGIGGIIRDHSVDSMEALAIIDANNTCWKLSSILTQIQGILNSSMNTEFAAQSKNHSAAEIYLCTKTRPNIERVKISKRHKDTNVSIKFAQSEKIADSFQGMELLWRFVNEEMKKTSKVIDEETDNVLLESEKRYFELCFDKKYTDKVLDSYVPFVLEKANSIRAENNVVKLHTLACAASYTSSNVWDSINLQHPSTFDTIAMDCGQKQALMDDLGRFLSRREFYRKVGRAWKRGYLLYGPPGTGKSSLIAAIANHLKFDVYDLELTNIKRNSDLRKIYKLLKLIICL